MIGESRQQIREGVVTQVFPSRHSARVEFADKGGLISDEYPILVPCAAKNKFYALPDVGDTVVCLTAGNSENVGDGWIIGARYHDKATTKVSSQDVSRMDFADGTYIQYDRKRHELRIECAGNVVINGKKIFLN